MNSHMNMSATVAEQSSSSDQGMGVLAAGYLRGAMSAGPAMSTVSVPGTPAIAAAWGGHATATTTQPQPSQSIFQPRPGSALPTTHQHSQYTAAYLPNQQLAGADPTWRLAGTPVAERAQVAMATSGAANPAAPGPVSRQQQQQGAEAFMAQLSSLGAQGSPNVALGTAALSLVQNHPANYAQLMQQWQRRQRQLHHHHQLQQLTQAQADMAARNDMQTPLLASQSMSLPPPMASPALAPHHSLKPHQSLSLPLPPPTPTLQPQLPAQHEAFAPAMSNSSSPTAASTPALAPVALPANGLMPSLLQSAFARAPSVGAIPEHSPATPIDEAHLRRAASSVGTSPALSAVTRQSRQSPNPQRKGARSPKRRGVAAAAGGARQKAGAPPAAKKARTIAALPWSPLHPSTDAAAMPPAMGTSLSAGILLETVGGLSRPGRGSHVVAKGGGAIRHPPASAVLPPTPLPSARGLRGMPQHLVQPREVLGLGMERLMAFHSMLAPSAEEHGLEYWNSAIAESFCDSGSVRLDFGAQSYDMPVATAGRFYHRLFSEGAAVSIHIALNDPSVHRLPNQASIISFHGVLMTTTYTGGRRVLETGELRVIFDHAFHIRVWAFTSNDAGICMPRKRPSGSDDAFIRTADATIARILDWPKDPPAPRRRKSAHGKQQPDEFPLPACALQHLEIATTMGLMQDLIRVQIQNPDSDMDVLSLWMATVNPKPLAAQPSTRTATTERKRQRRKSATAAPPHAAMPKGTDVEKPTHESSSAPAIAAAAASSPAPSPGTSTQQQAPNSADT